MTPVLLTLLGLGLLGGFFSGLLGIGGGIIMVPLLLYVPPLLGLDPINIKTAAGITMVQSLAGSLSGLVAQHRNNCVHRGLALTMGLPAAGASLLGAVLSKHLSGAVVYAVFAGLSLLAAVMMVFPSKAASEEAPPENVAYNRLLAGMTASFIGLAGGIIGQGGAFIMIPVMLYVLKIPTRTALGSSTAIALMSALAGFAGKWGTGQIPLVIAITVAVGAVAGAQLGGFAGKKMHTKNLRAILAVLIAGTALRMWYELSLIFFIVFGSALLLFLIVVFLRNYSRQKKTAGSIIPPEQAWGTAEGRDKSMLQ